MNATTETKTVEERSRELWELERQQKEEDRGGDCPDMPERLADPDYLTPAQHDDAKKIRFKFPALKMQVNKREITKEDFYIFGAGFLFAFLLIIIF